MQRFSNRLTKWLIFSGFSAVFVSSQPSPPNNNSEIGIQANGDTVRGSESNDAARAGSEQGVFLSNVMQQLMPLISSSREDGASTSTNTSSSTAQVRKCPLLQAKVNIVSSILS